MAARRLQSADRGFKVHESGAVVMTRPRKFMQDGQVKDIEAVVALLDGQLSLHGPGNTVWLRLCAEMQAWLRAHEAKLARLLGGDRRQWKAHRELAMNGTLGLCLAMRFTRSRWVRGHFLTMLRQHRVHTAVDLARAMSLAQASPTSVVYLGFSFKSSRPYIGMVHSRDPWLRFSEHWGQIDDHANGLADPEEAKYKYMASNGGVSGWHFLPLMVSPVVLPKTDVLRLEKHIWGRYPTRLNGMRHRLCRVRSLPDRTQTSNSRGTNPSSPSPHSLEPVIVHVMSHNAGVSAVEPSLQNALKTSPGATWHTSCPHSTLSVERSLGSSVVMVRQHGGGFVVAKLRAALKWTRKVLADWVTLTFIVRTVHDLHRGDDYEFLLALARHEVPKAEADDLLVE